MVSRCAAVVAGSLVVAALAQSVSAADVPLVDGTCVRVRLAHVISSETSTPGDVIACTVIQDVVVDGVLVIAHGTPVTGRIVTSPPCRSMSIDTRCAPLGTPLSPHHRHRRVNVKR